MSVSVIIPVYNGARYLVESIESALLQGNLTLEVLVIDDGSTDESAEIADKHVSERVRVYRKENGGVASACNLGVQNSKGQFIAFLDADDLWRPLKLQKQLELLSIRSDIGVVTSMQQNFWMPGLEHEAESNPDLKKPLPGVGSTFLARKSVFDQCGLLDHEFRNRDIQEWIVRVKREGYGHQTLNEILVDRRIHEANDSRIRKPGESELLDLASQLLTRRKKSRRES